MHLFDLPQPSVPVVDSSSLFPVRRIYCIGRNYGKHVEEMGYDLNRSRPFYFSKPADAIVLSKGTVNYPPQTEELHYEMELVVAIGKAGRDIAAGKSYDYVFGYAAGIDMTRRDLQHSAKKTGQPWEMAKGFDQSAPISSIHPVSEIGHPSDARIWLSVNGEIRQDANINELTWNVPQSIAELSSFVQLRPGDLIYTGTPSGVGKVDKGDKLTGGIDGIGTIEVTIK